MNISGVKSGVAGEARRSGLVRPGRAEALVGNDSNPLEWLCSAGLREATLGRVDLRRIDVSIVSVVWPNINGFAAIERLEGAVQRVSYGNELRRQCASADAHCNVDSSGVARSDGPMWNPVCGTRVGVPYFGACLANDTRAFLGCVVDRSFQQRMLEGAVAVNDRLRPRFVPPKSPDELENAAFAVRAQRAAISRSSAA